MGRKRCRTETFDDIPEICSPRKKGSHVDTPRKNKIIAAVKILEGKVPQKVIADKAHVSSRTLERILEDEAPRRRSKRLAARGPRQK